MAEIHSRSFEEARKAFFELEMQKAQNRIDFWRRKLEKAKYGTAQLECHKNASDAGWEYNFYKDALEALERVQQLEAQVTKWISVEERLPEDDVDVLVYIASKKENVDSVTAITHYTHSMYGYNIEGWCSPRQYCFWDREVTHWMPLPEPPKEG